MNPSIRTPKPFMADKVDHRPVKSALLAGAILCLALGERANAQTQYPYSEWVKRFHYADSVSNFAARQPRLHDMLLRLLKPLEEAARLEGTEAPEKKDAQSEKDRPEVSAKALLSGAKPPGKILEMDQSILDSLRLLAKNELMDALDSTAGMTPDRIDSLLAPVESNYRKELKIAKARNLKIVDRYLRKFGPGAPQLNLLETFAANILQHAPLFGPGGDGAGPLELVAGYSTTYFLAYQYSGASIPKELTVGSLLQLGIRWYQFDPWGQSKFWRLLTPGYLTLGAAWGGKDDWFLLWPRDNDFNLGGFLEISGVQLAVIPGENTKVYLGRRFQVVPYFF